MSGEAAAPLVSVVTASFNAVDGLRRTVESVAKQRFRSVEHIVIDGGSSDGTVDYLASLGERVRWLSEPDQGIADALNKGIAMARGEYVLVLQADDTFYDEESLAHAVPLLDGANEIVAFAVCMKYRDGQLRRLAPKGLGFLSRFQMTMPHQGVFCRRTLFERLGAFDTSFRIAMDYDFFLRCLNRGCRVVTSNEVLSIMPATGISSQPDWNSVSNRLAEFRRAQQRNLASPLDRLAGGIYWLAYLPYKRAKIAFGL